MRILPRVMNPGLRRFGVRNRSSSRSATRFEIAQDRQRVAVHGQDVPAPVLPSFVVQVQLRSFPMRSGFQPIDITGRGNGSVAIQRVDGFHRTALKGQIPPGLCDDNGLRDGAKGLVSATADTASASGGRLDLAKRPGSREVRVRLGVTLPVASTMTMQLRNSGVGNSLEAPQRSGLNFCIHGAHMYSSGYPRRPVSREERFSL